MFDELDRNGNGSITKSELKKNGYCKEDIASFFRTYDLDSKHKEVSKAEYLTIMFEALCTSMNDKMNRHYSKDVVLTGTQYEVKSIYDVNRRRRRRRILQDRSKGDCRL